MKFSVLLPTRNRLDLLHYAIETVRRQDYHNWEIIISDNFSDEDINGYVKSIGDMRILYNRTDSFVSVTENWNNALRQATGDYLIMLGDDDGLMPSFFHTIITLIGRYQQPDLIYTDAFLFAYPGALPEYQHGVIRYGYNTYFTSREPFLLEREIAYDLVRHALNLDIPIFYNMQLSIIKRSFIQSLAAQGEFFQSPFPDYYATIVSFLKAKSILIYQQPVVTIGISKKSFGFYFFSGRQREGESFLNNVPEQQSSRIQSVLLPSSVEYNCRLIAMDTVALNYPCDVQRTGSKVNYAKYRAMSIRFGIANYYSSKLLSSEHFAAIKQAMTLREWIFYGFPYTIVYGMLGLLTPSQRNRLKAMLRDWGWLRKVNETPWQATPYTTVVDVFEQLPSKL